MSGIDWGALIVGFYIGGATRPWIETLNAWARGGFVRNAKPDKENA